MRGPWPWGESTCIRVGDGNTGKFREIEVGPGDFQKDFGTPVVAFIVS